MPRGFHRATSSAESENDGFRSPEAAHGQTDYSLDYTHNENRIENPYNQIVTGNEKQTARKSTAQRVPVRRSTRHQERPPCPPPNTKQPRKRTPLTKEQREHRFWKEVRMLEDKTDNIVPKLPFARLVREIILSHSSTVQRITLEAMTGLQQAAEMYITQQLADAYLLTIHRGRLTLMPKDLHLVRALRWGL